MVALSPCCCCSQPIISNPLPPRVASFPVKDRLQIFTRADKVLPNQRVFQRKIVPRATTSEDMSSGTNQYVTEDRDAVRTVEEVLPTEKSSFLESSPSEVTKEEISVDEQAQSFDLIENIKSKFDSEDTVPIVLYGSGALVAVWLASAVVGAIDSIPLFPKLMEVVGLAYTFWFTSRYLLFKKSRDELYAKIEELKQQVLGLDD